MIEYDRHLIHAEGSHRDAEPRIAARCPEGVEWHEAEVSFLQEEMGHILRIADLLSTRQSQTHQADLHGQIHGPFGRNGVHRKALCLHLRESGIQCFHPFGHHDAVPIDDAVGLVLVAQQTRSGDLLRFRCPWAPKPEQIATARLLRNEDETDRIIDRHRIMVTERVEALYAGFAKMKAEGFPVDAIPAEGAMYLTVKIGLMGLTLPGGKQVSDAEDVTHFLLEEANLGLVPFYAFGASRSNPWFRISVGTLRMDQVPVIFYHLRKALAFTL